jgi:hypothetical protein
MSRKKAQNSESISNAAFYCFEQKISLTQATEISNGSHNPSESGTGFLLKVLPSGLELKIFSYLDKHIITETE